MSDLVTMSVVITREGRQQLSEIKEIFDLPNLHSAVEKAVEIACKTLKEKNEK